MASDHFVSGRMVTFCKYTTHYVNLGNSRTCVTTEHSEIHCR